MQYSKHPAHGVAQHAELSAHANAKADLPAVLHSKRILPMFPENVT